MQTPTQTEATATAQAPSVVTVGPDGRPLTVTIPLNRNEVRELLLRRQELSNQLLSVSARRRELSEEIRIAPDGASKKGLEDRLGVLDKRILQLEADIAATGNQIAAAPAALVATTRIPDTSEDLTLEPFFFAGGSALLGALAVILARRRWFRRRRIPAAKLSDDSARLERLEQGMEAIAIEIERVSEGQRFVTRLLAETHGEAAPRISERSGMKTPV